MTGIEFSRSRKIEDLCSPIAVPLFVGFEGRFGLHGMAFLFAVGSDHFLITCRHCVEDVVKKGAGLWVPRDNSTEAKPLTENFWFNKLPHCDIAVMKLPDEFVKWFGNHRFCRISDTFSSAQPAGISCVMFGYLAFHSQTWGEDVSSEDKCLRSVSFFGRTASPKLDFEFFDPSLHFLISNGKTSSHLLDDDVAVPFEIDSYKGLSGTPVFAVNEDPNDSNWQPSDARVIGIQSSCFGKGADSFLKVVRIELAIELIKTKFPETAETIEKLKTVKLFR